MLDERRRAEEALEERSVHWPSTAGRIRDARLRTGRTKIDIAAQLDMTPESYCDLENYDDEAYKCASLRQLATLGHTVGMQPRALLFGDEACEVQDQITFQDVQRRLIERLAQRKMTSQQFGHDLCKALDPDWVAALPMATNLNFQVARSTVSKVHKLIFFVFSCLRGYLLTDRWTHYRPACDRSTTS